MAITSTASTQPGPFVTNAAGYAAAGIPTFPLRPGEKKPAIRNWQKFSIGTALQLRDQPRFLDANLGIRLGTESGLTIVDLDDAAPELVAWAISHFGPTPIIVETASGKVHLWYRHAGEGRHIRPFKAEAKALDVLGEGIAVVPPSRTPAGEYRFVRGSLDDIPDLPTIRRGALPGRDDGADQVVHPLRSIPVGQRSDMLFRKLLRQVAACDGIEDLLDVATTINGDNMEEPLPDAEVRRTCQSVWKLQQERRNWVGQRARGVVTTDEWDQLIVDTDALALLVKLRMSHGAQPGKRFAVAARSMSEARTVPWSTGRIRNARETLVAEGFLRQVYSGGRGAKDPNQYVLATPRAKGQDSGPNITRTLVSSGRKATILPFRNQP